MHNNVADPVPLYLCALACVILLGAVGSSVPARRDQLALSSVPSPQSAEAASPVDEIRPVPPPASLQASLETLAEAFPGKIGMAVRRAGTDWTAGYRAGVPAPQQSLRKLWVASAVLRAVDRGEIHLDEPVMVTRNALTIFHQPIRTAIGKAGFQTDVADLLRRSLTDSDNCANDLLLKRIGGPPVVDALLTEAGLAEIEYGPAEQVLQMQIAGLRWDPSFSTGRAFWIARDRLPLADRQQAMSAYLAAPPDAATPDGIARALIELKRGAILSSASTRRMLDLMTESTTGSHRLKSGLKPGWVLAHKTGTGQVIGSTATAYNDVGLLTGPSGQTYAVVVMIARTEESIQRRQQLMRAVTQTVIRFDERDRDQPADGAETVEAKPFA